MILTQEYILESSRTREVRESKKKNLPRRISSGKATKAVQRVLNITDFNFCAMFHVYRSDFFYYSLIMTVWMSGAFPKWQLTMNYIIRICAFRAHRANRHNLTKVSVKPTFSIAAFLII